MKNKTLYFVIALVMVAVVAASIIIIMNSNGETPSISLPSPPSENSPPPDGNDIDRLKVTPKTVQAVIKLMDRTENYSHSYMLKTLWDGGSAKSDISVSKKDNRLRITQTQNDKTKNILIVNGTVSYWYSGIAGIITATMEDYSSTDGNQFARLISYEEILTLDVSKITDAGYETHQGEDCIFATYTSSPGYSKTIYISLISGLLLSSETYENDVLINSMETISTELSPPSDTVFDLPAK